MRHGRKTEKYRRFFEEMMTESRRSTVLEL